MQNFLPDILHLIESGKLGMNDGGTEPNTNNVILIQFPIKNVKPYVRNVMGYYFRKMPERLQMHKTRHDGKVVFSACNISPEVLALV